MLRTIAEVARNTREVLGHAPKLAPEERAYLAWGSTWLIRLIKHSMDWPALFAGPGLTLEVGAATLHDVLELAQDATAEMPHEDLTLEGIVEDVTAILDTLIKQNGEWHPDMRIAIEFFRILGKE